MTDHPPEEATAIEALRAAQLVAQYKAIAIQLDKYLEDGGPISDHLLGSIHDVTPTLQIRLDGWKKRNDVE